MIVSLSHAGSRDKSYTNKCQRTRNSQRKFQFTETKTAKMKMYSAERVRFSYIFLRISIWRSLRSYSCLIFFFSASTNCSFSMLNSCMKKSTVRLEYDGDPVNSKRLKLKWGRKVVTSSAETEISLAFSSASWRMNLTICWICLETSPSFIFAHRKTTSSTIQFKEGS